ncbi:MAG TPA: response regulator [Terracidiphilus sp.]|nr:response regulator [Terracidiphilus sp.]
MRGKILVVEDEPIVALDLQQEVEQLGLTVVGQAESADEALMAAEENRPDLALMDVRIVGSMDGIQTARLLREAYGIPVIFLTSYSDEPTIKRAARELPYGYLTKPFQRRELKAALELGLHRGKTEAQHKTEEEAITATVSGMREGVVLVSAARTVRFMNAAAEDLTGWPIEEAKEKPVEEVLRLGENSQCLGQANGTDAAVEEFGLALERNGGDRILVDLSVSPLSSHSGERTGWVISLRDAAERLRTQAVEEALEEGHSFHTAPIAMMQLDASGCIVRVNRTLLEETGVPAESLVGRTLTGLSMDPDPRIARDLMQKLLHGGAEATVVRQRVMN